MSGDGAWRCVALAAETPFVQTRAGTFVPLGSTPSPAVVHYWYVAV